ncbi:MAG: radical SAM/Cys-rich domain protein [Acidobacteria bacterium]|nr:radical SAM/Cys-rich domain protein [Acidobacteriota bacterium]MYJ04359.1 radical SAM/Cys-rich domain protein [Acidobacteriota bacterium]
MAIALPTLSAREAPLAGAREQLAVLRRLPIDREFAAALHAGGLHPLRPTSLEVLQINVGKLCNQTCRHCHVDAGPDRSEVMTRETMVQCVEALRGTAIPTVDITGGAPELNPNFRWLVEQCSALGRHVIDRCNLTVLNLPSQADLVDFLARHRVEVVCSLPHYRQLNTDAQRGEGVFEKSIEALQRLNAAGYGAGRSGLRLVLVTNPVGAYLPPRQASLEQEWKRELDRRYGIRFDALYTITNMPISRFLEWLIESGNLESYMHRLVDAYNPTAARGVMCRNTLSVGWDGTLYDCDFNQMLELPVNGRSPRHIGDFDLGALEARTIVTDRHCFGCTAGAGSSCSGATVE